MLQPGRLGADPAPCMPAEAALLVSIPSVAAVAAAFNHSLRVLSAACARHPEAGEPLLQF